ncbi:restriction endonuclease subunit S [Bacillus atrophaeus]|uniref:restriction endonuclease subunit S n=1 Tax=Bacillus atrophaeus TaxID=1452 RepID=UPI003873301A
MRDKNLPEIRFQGFSGKWEQMKLGEVVEIKDSARISNTLWVSKGVPYLRSSDLANDEIEGKLFISNETYQSYKDKTGAPENDDVLFTSGGKVGVTYHKIDDNPVYVQGGSILYAKTSTSNKLSGIYLKAFFSSPTMTKYIDGASTGLTIKHFTLKPANAAPIFISSLKEQNKIGEFFKQIDDITAFHQQELTTLKQTKQGFLQKMFPKKGESVPEVRFDGFGGNWEEQKLNYFLEVSNEKNYENEFSKRDVFSVSGEYGIVNQIDFQGRSFAGESVANYGIVKKGYVVYTKSPLKANPYGIIKTNNGKSGIVSTLYAVYKPKETLHPPIIEIMFENDSVINNYLRPLVNKGAKNDMKVRNEDVLKGKIRLPDIEEQIKISNFFKQLDDTIALHQRELDALKETKKAFLQKMFV